MHPPQSAACSHGASTASQCGVIVSNFVTYIPNTHDQRFKLGNKEAVGFEKEADLGVVASLAGDTANEPLAGEGSVAHDDEAGVGDLADAFPLEREALADELERLVLLGEVGRGGAALCGLGGWEVRRGGRRGGGEADLE